MATKESLRKTTLAALQRWPKDPLRPNAQLHDVLTARLDKAPPSESEARAINNLVSNAFKNKYALNSYAESTLPGGLMKPRSNPEYYETLIKDLDEVPTRTASQSWVIRLKNLFRWG